MDLSTNFYNNKIKYQLIQKEIKLHLFYLQFNTNKNSFYNKYQKIYVTVIQTTTTTQLHQHQ